MGKVDDSFRPPYWRLIESWWGRVTIYDGPDRFLEDFAAAPEPVGHLLAAHWLQSEVRNGGFGQFFDNPTGVLAPEAERAFRVIGMPKAADVVASQMKAFGDAYPRDQDTRQEKMSAVYEEFERLAKVGDFDALNVLGEAMGPGDEDMWDLLKLENGGFVACADRYAMEADPDLA